MLSKLILSAVLCIAANTAFAAIAKDSLTSTTNTGTAPTVTHTTTGSGEIVYLFIRSAGTSTYRLATSVTDTLGNAWFKRISCTSGVYAYEGWYTYSPSKMTSATITANFPASVSVRLTVLSITGANIRQPFDINNQGLSCTFNASTVTTRSTTLSTTQSPTMTIAQLSSPTAAFTSPVLAAGFSSAGSAAGTATLINYRVNPATIGSESVTWSWTNSQLAGLLVDSLQQDSSPTSSGNLSLSVEY